MPTSLMFTVIRDIPPPTMGPLNRYRTPTHHFFYRQILIFCLGYTAFKAVSKIENEGTSTDLVIWNLNAVFVAEGIWVFIFFSIMNRVPQNGERYEKLRNASIGLITLRLVAFIVVTIYFYFLQLPLFEVFIVYLITFAVDVAESVVHHLMYSCQFEKYKRTLSDYKKRNQRVQPAGERGVEYDWSSKFFFKPVMCLCAVSLLFSTSPESNHFCERFITAVFFLADSVFFALRLINADPQNSNEYWKYDYQMHQLWFQRFAYMLAPLLYFAVIANIHLFEYTFLANFALVVDARFLDWRLEQFRNRLGIPLEKN